MASGHEPPYYTKVMNKVYRSVDDNGNRPGYMNGLFSTTRLEVEAYNLSSAPPFKQLSRPDITFSPACVISGAKDHWV